MIAILTGIGNAVIIYGIIMALIHILGFVGQGVDAVVNKVSPIFSKMSDKIPLSSVNKKRVGMISFTILILIIIELTL